MRLECTPVRVFHPDQILHFCWLGCTPTDFMVSPVHPGDRGCSPVTPGLQPSGAHPGEILDPGRGSEEGFTGCEDEPADVWSMIQSMLQSSVTSPWIVEMIHVDVTDDFVAIHPSAGLFSQPLDKTDDHQKITEKNASQILHASVG